MPKGIFNNPIERINKIRLSKLGSKRKPFSKEWKQKISDGLRNSGAGKYVRTYTTKEKARIVRLNQKFDRKTRDIMTNALISTNKERKGVKHHNWKGGITTENAKTRSSRRYAKWRTTVFERDDYTCIDCCARNGNGVAIYLEAHHIKSFAEYPDLRFDIDNGITLCRGCHKKTETYARRRKKL